MKLHPTTEKVQIKWFAVLSPGVKVRNNAGFIHNAWDVECSCGWATKTGGAITSWMQDEVKSHKIQEHNYTYKFGA